MHLEVSNEFTRQFLNNPYLVEKIPEFSAAIDQNKLPDFWHDNPKFLDLLKNLSQSTEIKLVKDET